MEVVQAGGVIAVPQRGQRGLEEHGSAPRDDCVGQISEPRRILAQLCCCACVLLYDGIAQRMRCLAATGIPVACHCFASRLRAAATPGLLRFGYSAEKLR